MAFLHRKEFPASINRLLTESRPVLTISSSSFEVRLLRRWTLSFLGKFTLESLPSNDSKYASFTVLSLATWSRKLRRLRSKTRSLRSRRFLIGGVAMTVRVGQQLEVQWKQARNENDVIAHADGLCFSRAGLLYSLVNLNKWSGRFRRGVPCQQPRLWLLGGPS